MVADVARRKVIINHWFVSVETSKQERPVSSRAARQSKEFPTEIEAKQFAKAMLSEGLKVTAGTLSGTCATCSCRTCSITMAFGHIYL
jgi:hypothetical protein